MMRTLLMLILCAYGTACHADATLSDIATPEPKAKIRTKPRIVAKTAPKKIVVMQRKATTKAPPTYTMKTKRAEKTTKQTVVKRPPVISYTPATTKQLRTAQEKLQQQQADRIHHSRFSQALVIYSDPKSSIQQKTHAGNEMLESMKKIKTPEKQTAVRKQLQKYNITEKGLQQDVASGTAYTRIQEHAAKRIKPGQDIKSDPTIATDYKKLTSYHRALADRHLATIRKS
jgi:hypothetical protein